MFKKILSIILLVIVFLIPVGCSPSLEVKCEPLDENHKVQNRIIHEDETKVVWKTVDRLTSEKEKIP